MKPFEPQSRSLPQAPSGALAHLPLRQLAPPQSRSEPQDESSAVAHLPLQQLTPAPQSRSLPQAASAMLAPHRTWKIAIVVRATRATRMRNRFIIETVHRFAPQTVAPRSLGLCGDGCTQWSAICYADPITAHIMSPRGPERCPCDRLTGSFVPETPTTGIATVANA
jgi:hypothetical protein